MFKYHSLWTEMGGGGPGEKEQEHKDQKKTERKRGRVKKKRQRKRKETWHFSRTLSCRPADIIIVKLGGRFRLSCRCGSLKSHSMSPCHFSSTSPPKPPLLYTLPSERTPVESSLQKAREERERGNEKEREWQSMCEHGKEGRGGVWLCSREKEG